MRNHAFLYSGLAGWRLAPVYDLNPTPTDIKPRILSTAITLTDATASLDLSTETARYFDLEKSQVKKIVQEVGAAVASWRKEALRFKIKKDEIERMSSAFEHDDLRQANR